MINNNIKMIQKMKRPFDYEEYLFLCSTHKIEPVDEQRFCSGMGLLERAKIKYSTLNLQEAYIKVIQDRNDMHNKDKKKECCSKNKDKALPPLSKQIMSYAKNQALWVLAGKPVVSKDKFLRRLSICIKCDKLNNDWNCSECGCPMKEKAERDMKELCTLNKW